MAYQALYRRYRPGTFSELVGQEHVVRALRNAVREERVGHAYLFSGPRGTGKTTTARILAKALNCQNLGDDGEPCCTCASCAAFAEGTSFDLHELDAASNNKVDDVRDLINRVALGSPGRTKVYVLDEVHMLTAGAENALLKTLEEPPPHVVFVLATTEPHKVIPTIRSRTQHLEFDLIPAAELAEHVRWVAGDAGIELTDEVLEHVLREGGGSARDTLSALDQAAIAGGIRHDDEPVERIVDGLCDQDGNAALLGVTDAINHGRDPRVVGEEVLASLRDAFLAAMGAPAEHLPESASARAADVAERMGPAAITRALETLGAALVEMRQAPDPRIDLEVAVIRLTRPDLSTDLAALVERIEQLERGAPATPARPPAEREASAEPVREGPSRDSPLAAARETLADKRGKGRSRTTDAPAPQPPPADAPEPPRPGPSPSAAAPPADAPEPPPTPPTDAADDPGTSGPLPGRDEVAMAWGDAILGSLPNKARTRFAGGRFLPSAPDALLYALPNDIHRSRCEEVRSDVDAALAAHFGRPVALRLVVDDGDTPESSSVPAATPTAPPPSEQLTEPEADEDIDPHDLRDAPDDKDPIDRLTETFPGARLVDADDG